MEVGAYEEGLTHAEHALDIAKREGEPYSELLARLGMGRNLIQLNRNREAVVCLDTAVTLIERDGYAEALFGVGDIDKSLAAADRAVGIGRRISNPCLMVQGLGLRARLNAAASRGTSEIEADLAEQRTLCFRYGLVAEV